jgi:hypothetical protein
VQKPPPHLLLAYRLLGWRVGPAHREWVHDDLTRRGWLVRLAAPVVVALVAVGAAFVAAVGGRANSMLALLAVVAGVALFLRTSLQRLALGRQGIDAAGNPTATWYDDAAALRRRNLLGAVATVVLALGALLLLALRSR